MKQNYLSEDELRTISTTNSILSPTSLLISKNIEIGENNTFYPNVVIETNTSGDIRIGNNNVFYPGTYILAADGKITIGDNNDFGPSGLTIKANFPDAVISIGSHGRYSDSASIMGRTTLGDGSQILGNISVQNCNLDGGASFTNPDPDLRGAVLKGMGLARNLTIETGQVINGLGDFSKAPIEQQSIYHPKKA